MLRLAEVHDVNPSGDGVTWWLDQCELLDVFCNNELVGALALSSYKVGDVSTVEIEAAACTDSDCTAPALALLEQLCKTAGANRIESKTMRPALVKNLTRTGWKIKAVTLEKDI
jgi:hypothetical protein